jgi:hypothetical protein
LTSVVHRLEGEVIQGKNRFTLRELSSILEDTRRTFGAFSVEAKEDEPVGLTTTPPPEASIAPAVPHAPEQTVEAPTPPAAAEQPFPALAVFDIDDSDRRKFVKKIFRQDESAFDTTILTLSRTPSWRKASALIDEVFINNDVDPYSSEARRFTELIYHRYTSPK